MLLSTRPFTRLPLVCLIALAICASGCSAGTVSATTTSNTTPGATATPASSCLQLIPNATLANGVNGVPGIQLPSGTYTSLATASGGGVGQYTVQSYALCFHGAESAIDGSVASSSSTSTLGQLVQAGWVLNNLFPNPVSVAYLDPCINGQTCINTSGTPDPFTFLGVDQFFSQSGVYTTFRLQVATVVAPTCLNDPNYYSGTPQYVLFEDSATATAGTSGYPDHFQMPPGTRKSSFLGGGTAGSVYTYFCSAGMVGTVNGFLTQSLHTAGYTIGETTAGCFTANEGTSPTFSIQVCVTNPNNYYLRIFVPI